MGALPLDFDAHGTGGAGDDLDGCVEIVGIKLRHLDLGDLLELGTSDLTDFVHIWLTGTFLDFDLFTDHVVDRLAETVPSEGSVFVNLNMDDDVFTLEIFCSLVEGVDELHHVEAPLAEGATDWRTSGGAATWDA